MPKKLTQGEFLRRAKAAHGDRFDLSKAKYIDYSTKVSVICRTHGEFAIAPGHLMKGVGCSKCYFDSQKQDQETVIARFKTVHGDRYDYSKVEYERCDHKVTIICPKHGEFKQLPKGHIKGYGCKKCADENQKFRKRKITKNQSFNSKKKINLIDKKFGKLTVIDESSQRIRNQVTWTCQCECGNTYVATTVDLLHRNKHHCGCVKSFKQICKEKGVNYWRALKRREAGMSQEQIFETDYVRVFKDTIPINVYGINYPTLQAAIEELKPVATKGTIQRWLEQGFTLEEAFERIPNPGYANGIIYLVTNKINGKQYIGLTIQTIKRRWKYHLEQAKAEQIKDKNSLHAAIRKYGEDCFEIEQIDCGTTKKDLEEKECYWIKEKNTLVPNGYNISPGGTSGGANKKPTEIDGILFDSVKSAAAYLAEREDISLVAAKKRISNMNLDTMADAVLGKRYSHTKVYRAWHQIIYGTTNPKSKDYIPNLEIQESWKSFDIFLQDVGNPPNSNMAFVRLDKSKGFFLDNCAWVSKKEASRINGNWIKFLKNSK